MPNKNKMSETTQNKSVSSEKRGRPKGLPKTGGRKAGTPNKMTKSIRAQIEQQLEPFVANIGNMLLKITDPADRFDALVKLLPYVAPKLQNIDITSENKHDVTIEHQLLLLDEKFKEKEQELTIQKIKMISFD